MVINTYGDFPYENIGFDTPSLVGGVLMCFIGEEQNRKCHNDFDYHDQNA